MHSAGGSLDHTGLHRGLGGLQARHQRCGTCQAAQGGARRGGAGRGSSRWIHPQQHPGACWARPRGLGVCLGQGCVFGRARKAWVGWVQACDTVCVTRVTHGCGAHATTGWALFHPYAGLKARLSACQDAVQWPRTSPAQELGPEDGHRRGRRRGRQEWAREQLAGGLPHTSMAVRYLVNTSTRTWSLKGHAVWLLGT